MEELPPDLTRLGRDLSTAIDRSLRVQRFRRRLMRRTAAVGSAGALIFVVMTPAVLGPGLLEASRNLARHDDRLVCEPTRTRSERGAPTCFTVMPAAGWLPERLTD